MAGPGAVSLELGARVTAGREPGGRKVVTPDLAVLAALGRISRTPGPAVREAAVPGGGRPEGNSPRGPAVPEPCELRRHGLKPGQETARPDPLDYNARLTLRRCRCPFPYLEPVIRD